MVPACGLGQVRRKFRPLGFISKDSRALHRGCWDHRWNHPWAWDGGSIMYWSMADSGWIDFCANRNPILRRSTTMFHHEPTWYKQHSCDSQDQQWSCMNHFTHCIWSHNRSCNHSTGDSTPNGFWRCHAYARHVGLSINAVPLCSPQAAWGFPHEINVQDLGGASSSGHPTKWFGCSAYPNWVGDFISGYRGFIGLTV